MNEKEFRESWELNGSADEPAQEVSGSTSNADSNVVGKVEVEQITDDQQAQPPSQIEKIQAACTMLERGLALSKSKEFAPLGLQFSDLEFLHSCMKEGLTALSQLQVLGNQLIQRDSVLIKNLQVLTADLNVFKEAINKMVDSMETNNELANLIVKLQNETDSSSS